MRVTLRGESSLDLSNNGALFVIDGVPMFNTSSGMGESAYAIDYGNGTGDINPDDIDNITVLKGPAATALYGSEAANGAIVITTKSGDKEDGNVSVTFSSDFVAEVVNTSPDLQYGPGRYQRTRYVPLRRAGRRQRGYDHRRYIVGSQDGRYALLPVLR